LLFTLIPVNGTTTPSLFFLSFPPFLYYAKTAGRPPAGFFFWGAGGGGGGGQTSTIYYNALFEHACYLFDKAPSFPPITD